MPELAEVEFNRRQWNPGLGHKVLAVHLAAGKRVIRGVRVAELRRALTGATLKSSEAHGKQMLFGFTGGGWLGVHLGMTGGLACQASRFKPGRHDHLTLVQAGRCLVFHDPRQFGRIRFHAGPQKPGWWAHLPPEVLSRPFTPDLVYRALKRHPRLPVKAALLLQQHFPGIGNWMADEILWRVGLHPRTPCAHLNDVHTQPLWREIRAVSRLALTTIGQDGGDPPRGWLFHERWGSKGFCPKHGLCLSRATISGRTAAWCPKCQPG